MTDRDERPESDPAPGRSTESPIPLDGVAEGEAGPVGLAVDGASEVATISDAEVLPPPETVLTSETAEAFQGVARYGERLIVLLDLDKALPRTEYETQSATGTPDGDEDG